MLSKFARSLLFVFAVLFLLATIALLHPPTRAYVDPWTHQILGEDGVQASLPNQANHVQIKGTQGGVIMGKLGNETAKAALGRATWKLLHTVTMRFPEHPTLDEREALESYFHLSSRLYPCGECAAEFQALLKQYPPQTSSRKTASFWLCAVHNKVNERLKKPIFDCAHLSTEYDCGCGDEPVTPVDGSVPTAKASDPMDLEDDMTRDELTGADMIRGG